jgi:hypothetical protein
MLLFGNFITHAIIMFAVRIVSQEEAYRLKEIIKQIMLNTECYVNMCPIYDCCYGCSGCVCVCVCVVVIIKSAHDSAYTDSIIVTVLM